MKYVRLYVFPKPLDSFLNLDKQARSTMSPQANSLPCDSSHGSPSHTCRLTPTRGEPLDTLAADPMFGEDVRSMKKWTEVDFRLPEDATLEETLLRIGKDDPCAHDDVYLKYLENTMYDRHKDSDCGMTKQDIRSVTVSAMRTKFPGMYFGPVYKYFLHITQDEPATAFYPSIFEAGLGKFRSRLVRTIDGEVGHIQSIQFACHRSGCSRPTLQDGDPVVLDDRRNWCHPSIDETRLGFLPALRFPGRGCSVVSCGESFSGHPVALFSIFGSLPKHLFHDADADGVPFTCDGASMTRARQVVDEDEKATERYEVSEP